MKVTDNIRHTHTVISSEYTRYTLILQQSGGYFSMFPFAASENFKKPCGFLSGNLEIRENSVNKHTHAHARQFTANRLDYNALAVSFIPLYGLFAAIKACVPNKIQLFLKEWPKTVRTFCFRKAGSHGCAAPSGIRCCALFTVKNSIKYV